MSTVDTIIYPKWIIPVEPKGVIEKHALVINKGKIKAILTVEEAKNIKATKVIELPTHALIPGLVNSHTHAAMSLMRGYADDKALMDWLQNHIWPAEQKHVSETFVSIGSQLAIAEMLLGGTTCFNDMYFFPNITAEVAQKAGIRATVGLIVLDFPTVWAKAADEYLHKADEVHEQIKSLPLISSAIAPHAPYTVSDDPLKKIKARSDKWQVPIHIHLHETKSEVTESRPIQRLNNLGLLSERLQAVHMTQLTEGEVALIAKKGTQVIHCPQSNLKLASGICPVAKLIEAGVNVALGTDGAASNNDLDMLSELQTAALIAKSSAEDPTVLNVEEALSMATISGAKALGLEDQIGTLSPGKQADIVAIDLSAVSCQPVYNAISTIIYSASRDQVTDVWVAGKQVVKQRQLTTINTTDLIAEVTHIRNKL